MVMVMAMAFFIEMLASQTRRERWDWEGNIKAQIQPCLIYVGKEIME